jgi:hypothetical protein
MRLVLIAEDHIAVTEVVLASCAGLGPLKSRKGNQVLAVAVAADSRALPEDFLVLAQLTWSEGFRMIGESKKIQRRAVASKITGVRRRVRTGSSEYRQREDESIPGNRAMHMQIAK